MKEHCIESKDFEDWNRKWSRRRGGLIRFVILIARQDHTEEALRDESARVGAGVIFAKRAI